MPRTSRRRPVRTKSRSRRFERNAGPAAQWTRNFGFPTSWTTRIGDDELSITLEATQPMLPAVARAEINGKLAGRYDSLREAKEAVEAEAAAVPSEIVPAYEVDAPATMGAALLAGRSDVLVSQETIDYDEKWSPYQRAVFDFVRKGKGNAIVEAVAGSGKAQPDSAMVLTENGNARIGDVRIGDTVLGRNSERKTVSGVFPQGVKPVFLLTLANGAATECTDDHLWLVASDDAPDGKVRRFAEVMENPSAYRVPMASGEWSTIRSIDAAGDKECRCISVGGDGLYVTDGGIVTHNTTTLMQALEYIPRDASVLILAFNSAIQLELQSRAPRNRNLTIKTLTGWGLSFLRRHWKTPMASQSEGNRRDDAVVEESIPSFRESGLPFQDDPETGSMGYDTLKRSASTLIGLCMSYMAVSDASITEVQRDFDLFVDDDGDPEGFVLYGPMGPDHSEEKPAQWTHRDVLAWVKTAISLQLKEPKDGGSISFRDMVFVPAMHPGWKAPELYDFVFVDETQDCDVAQLSLVMRAVKSRGRIIVIGDRNQSIYRFRGADTDAMPRLERELNATRLPLSVSYRVTQCAADEARKVVGDFDVPRNARGESMATPGICNEISARKMAALWDAGDVVITRSTKIKGEPGLLSKIALKVFVTGKIPYVMGDPDALPKVLRGALKQITASKYMKLGNDTIEAFHTAIDEWVAQGQERFRLDLIEARKRQEAVLKRRYRGHRLDDGVEDFEEWKRFDEIRSCFFNSDGTGIAQQEGVTDLGSIETRIKQLSPTDDELERMTPERFKKIVAQCVTISTTHKIKGAEFPRVFVLESTFGYTRTGLQPRRKQKPKAAIEEKNLWYVAITRVKGERGNVERGIMPREGELYYVNDIESLVRGKTVKDLNEVMK